MAVVTLNLRFVVVSKGSTLVYSTYVGGSAPGMDKANGITVDDAGNAYVVGSTTSLNFPVTSGALQGQNRSTGRNSDAFLTKLNASGSGIIFATYLGGLVSDEAFGGCIDQAGNVYISGRTDSRDRPIV